MKNNIDRSSNVNYSIILVIGLSLIVSGCISNGQNPANSATSNLATVDADKLLPVDCLLPSQVRRLGTQMTYLAARKAIKTTGLDCEIRGGEYVAYDRADYRSSLNIWL